MANTTRLFALARLIPARMGLPALALAAVAAAVLQGLWAEPVQAQATAQSPATDAKSAPAAGFAPSPTRATRPTAVGCLIGPERLADVGTPVTGVIASVKVDRGDNVKKGQPLIVLDSSIEQAGVQAAQARSVIDADVRAAEASLILARQKLQRLEGLVAEGFVTPQALEQARAERDVADQKVRQAVGQRKVQAQELGIVRAQLGQRTLRSPFDGVVAERFVNSGERAEEKPLLRVAMLDPLRVELVVPATRWGGIHKGDRIGIVPELPGAGAMLARVTHVDKIIDAASNTFRVRLALPNPGHKLPAGARCKLDAPASAAPAVPAASAAQVLPVATRQPADAPRRPRLKITV